MGNVMRRRVKLITNVEIQKIHCFKIVSYNDEPAQMFSLTWPTVPADTKYGARGLIHDPESGYR